LLILREVMGLLLESKIVTCSSYYSNGMPALGCARDSLVEFDSCWY
jgi:hypothetical protein